MVHLLKAMMMKLVLMDPQTKEKRAVLPAPCQLLGVLLRLQQVQTIVRVKSDSAIPLFSATW